MVGGGAYVKENFFKHQPEPFKSVNYVFMFDRKRSVIQACKRWKTTICADVVIKEKTFPYVYAADPDSDDVVLAVTNYGDALLFRNGAWCRMIRSSNDQYFCDGVDRVAIDEPRGVQFYSSVLFEGKTLVGEWPTGRLYEFKGGKLFPSALSPNILSQDKPISNNYEAQSIAMYCGDLFVGYWPRGEIYRFDHVRREWSLFVRLFDHPEDEDVIPYSIRENDGLVPAFFGQRVTALVPFGESLYAVTSNLNGWRGERTFLSDKQEIQYGSVWEINRSSCRTRYVK